MVAFVVDELSMEDLSAAALADESLKNLESLVESSSNSVVLPLVAGSVVHELATTIRLQQGSVVSMTTSEFMSATLASSNALYIVRVTTSKSDSKELTLAKLDAYVAAAMKRVAGRSVVAILTSNTESPSLLPETASETIAVARRAFSQPNLANINRLSQKVNKDYMYFTIPIFMGIVVGLFMVFVVLVGISGIMATQTPDQFANTNDKPLQVPQ